MSQSILLGREMFATIFSLKKRTFLRTDIYSSSFVLEETNILTIFFKALLNLKSSEMGFIMEW